jgi:hypothetical protein
MEVQATTTNVVETLVQALLLLCREGKTAVGMLKRAGQASFPEQPIDGSETTTSLTMTDARHPSTMLSVFSWDSTATH